MTLTSVGTSFHGNACSDSSHSRGVTILFSENFKCKILNTEIGENERILLI